MKDFVGYILEKDYVELSVFYTALDSKKLRKGVLLYGKESKQISMDVPQFINLLSNYYPYVCAWKAMSTRKAVGEEFIVDHFEGEETAVWWMLTKNSKITIVPHSDNCNPFLSTADLLIRWIDISLRDHRLHLDEEGLSKLIEDVLSLDLGSRLEVSYIGHPELSLIVPQSHRKINPVDYYVRPIIWIIKPGQMKGERNLILIEQSPFMAKVYNKAFDIGGGVVFLDPERHADK